MDRGWNDLLKLCAYGKQLPSKRRHESRKGKSYQWGS